MISKISVGISIKRKSLKFSGSEWKICGFFFQAGDAPPESYKRTLLHFSGGIAKKDDVFL